MLLAATRILEIDCSGISNTPCGRRRAFEIIERRKLEPGQSGSPRIEGGKVVRMAQAKGMCSLDRGRWARAEKTQAFLRPRRGA